MRRISPVEHCRSAVNSSKQCKPVKIGLSNGALVFWTVKFEIFGQKWTFNTSHSRNSCPDRDLQTSALVNSYTNIECMWDFIGPERKLLNRKDRIIRGQTMLTYINYATLSFFS
ncbi:unnamed protein product [Malus baccata var. baccata]